MRPGALDRLREIDWPGRLGQWRRVAVDLLFPPRCVVCDVELEQVEDDVLFCGPCRGKVAVATWRCCRGCGAAIPPDRPTPETCSQCRSRRFRFDRVVPLGPYRDELQQAVLRMKNAAGQPLSVAIGRLYGQMRGGELAALKPTAVVPIPMYWFRRLTRNANSPEVVAAQLAGSLGVPLLLKALRRRRNTALQRSLLPRERLRNVHRAFRLAKGYDFRGARVILVDDVLTTGATCDAAAAPFKQAGASIVAVAVLARAEGDS